jgi:hypothetical protein
LKTLELSPSPSDDLDELKNAWTPAAMLPKMYVDREIRKMKAAEANQ